MCYLANKLHSSGVRNGIPQISNKSLEQIVRQAQVQHYVESVGYTGRPTVQ